MPCNCAKRAAGLLGRLGFAHKGPSFQLHRRSGYLYIDEASLMRHHFRLTLLGLFTRLLLPRTE